MKKLLMTASCWSHIHNFHLPYLQEFHSLGWEVHVGCKGIPACTPYSYIDREIELPFEKSYISFANLRVAKAIHKLAKDEHYDLIITHTSLAAFFTRMAVKGMRNRPKLVNVVHGYLFDDKTPILKHMLLLAAERLTASETDLLLTMNDWDFKEAKLFRLGKQIEKISGMGVDFSKLDSVTAEDGRTLRSSLGIPSDAFVLIYPAEFSRRKSQHVLIEAMQYLPSQVWLILCGEGALLPACKTLAKKLYVADRVLFPGQILDIAPWYRMADALVASSRSEGLPFNLMEALYIGLPVVASDVKGHNELIKEGETGLLYPYGNAGSCAKSIENMMAIKAGTMINNGKTVSEQYRLDLVLPQVMTHYINIVL